MVLTERAARVGTAGFVLSRLLLEPPSQALAENFGNSQMRATWPLQAEVSRAALERITPEPHEELVRDHARLFRNHPPLVPIHETAVRQDLDDSARHRAELIATYEEAGLRPVPTDDHVGNHICLLAHLATRESSSQITAAQEAARTALAFRARHLEPVLDPVLEGIAEHARTQLYRELPVLLREFLSEHFALCEAVIAHHPE